VSDDDAATLSLETSAAAAESDGVAEVSHGMTEVASAPSLLMMSVNVDELPLTEAMSDMSLTADDDSRPFAGTDGDGKPQLDNAFYFYQGELVISSVHIRANDRKTIVVVAYQSSEWTIAGKVVKTSILYVVFCSIISRSSILGLGLVFVFFYMLLLL